MGDTPRGLRVIGAGMGRTGTASLKLALEQLGFGPCHHMEEVVKHPAEVPTWEKAARGEKIDWRTFLAGWGSAVDFPSAFYYRELMTTFPDAKVILTVRDADTWYESMGQTIVAAITAFPGRLVVPYLPFVSAPGRVTEGTFLKKEIVDHYADRARIKKLFLDWNEEVKRTVPPERLLVHEAKEGWKPLCEFLGVPVRDGPYPRVNDTVEFRRRVHGGNLIATVVLFTPVVIALAILRWLF